MTAVRGVLAGEHLDLGGAAGGRDVEGEDVGPRHRPGSTSRSSCRRAPPRTDRRSGGRPVESRTSVTVVRPPTTIAPPSTVAIAKPGRGSGVYVSATVPPAHLCCVAAGRPRCRSERVRLERRRVRRGVAVGEHVRVLRDHVGRGHDQARRSRGGDRQLPVSGGAVAGIDRPGSMRAQPHSLYWSRGGVLLQHEQARAWRSSGCSVTTYVVRGQVSVSAARPVPAPSAGSSVGALAPSVAVARVYSAVRMARAGPATRGTRCVAARAASAFVSTSRRPASARSRTGRSSAPAPGDRRARVRGGLRQRRRARGDDKGGHGEDGHRRARAAAAEEAVSGGSSAVPPSAASIGGGCAGVASGASGWAAGRDRWRRRRYRRSRGRRPSRRGRRPASRGSPMPAARRPPGRRLRAPARVSPGRRRGGVGAGGSARASAARASLAGRASTAGRSASDGARGVHAPAAGAAGPGRRGSPLTDHGDADRGRRRRRGGGQLAGGQRPLAASGEARRGRLRQRGLADLPPGEGDGGGIAAAGPDIQRHGRARDDRRRRGDDRLPSSSSPRRARRRRRISSRTAPRRAGCRGRHTARATASSRCAARRASSVGATAPSPVEATSRLQRPGGPAT